LEQLKQKTAVVPSTPPAAVLAQNRLNMSVNAPVKHRPDKAGHGPPDFIKPKLFLRRA
jgi:hypothetical protein